MPDSDRLDSRGNRSCTNCGKSVDDESYQLWLFHTCRHCALDATPVRFSNGIAEAGTYRKWRYYPDWHMTRHPDLPERHRKRHGATA